MARLTVVVSQGQSANPKKRALEEEIVTSLLFEKGIEVTVIPNLYDLKPDGTGMLCLKGIPGNVVICSWLYPRAAHWVLDRNSIKGHVGKTLLRHEDEDDDEAAPVDEETANEEVVGPRDVPNRHIYCLDLRAYETAQPYVDEVKRIAAEATVQTVNLMGFLGGNQASSEQTARYLDPAPGNVDSARNTQAGGAATSGNGAAPASNIFGNGNGNGHEPIDLSGESATVAGSTSAAQSNGIPAPVDGEALRVDEQTGRRWYPVIDFSRCTNCMECLDFCLFGVYGVDRFDTILVEQPDNCRKGCPACSRVCPANAIIFPQHKTPAIAGAPEAGGAAAFKIDLSKLFGAPEGIDAAVEERDAELVAAGRDAVGASVGIPKRQEGKGDGPKDKLDDLMDELDDLDL